MTPDEFITAIGPAAVVSMTQTRIPASFTVAEGALESGWGKSLLAAQAKNLFGVKADASWHGPTISMRTREVIHGQSVIQDALWRKYDTWLACLEDHAKFLLENPRYKPAFAFSDGEHFARAVAKAGYATDPNYANKIISVIHSHDLGGLDHA